MTTTDFTITLLVNETPEEAFNAINNVRGWWSETIEGNTNKLHDEFIYRHKDVHYSKQRLIEVIPNKKVVWLVTDSHLSFIKKENEWNNTKISFEISIQGKKTQMRFIHIGLSSQFECFDACSNAWSYYLNSLLNLITTGEGQPDKKEKSTKTI